MALLRQLVERMASGSRCSPPYSVLLPLIVLGLTFLPQRCTIALVPSSLLEKSLVPGGVGHVLELTPYKSLVQCCCQGNDACAGGCEAAAPSALDSWVPCTAGHGGCAPCVPIWLLCTVSLKAGSPISME